MKRQFKSLALALAMLTLAGAQAVAQVPTANLAAPFPISEISYPGASAIRAFVAKAPYRINVMGTMKEINLLGTAAARAYEFGGDVPFVNPISNLSDPAVLQAWDSATNAPKNMTSTSITNSGFVDHTVKNSGQLMVRYKAGDGIVAGAARSTLVSYPVPPRTHVRWELEVSFGSVDGENMWPLTTPDLSPVLFWELKSPNAGTPALQAVADTDPKDPTKLRLKLMSKAGLAPALVLIGQASGIPRATPIPIVIEAFLDERETSAGGKGRVRAWINGVLIGDLTGPTLTVGPNEHVFHLATYAYKELKPAPYTRATFWKTARMMVYP